MAATKKCEICKYKVPKDAMACGHCGAHFEKYVDKSVGARLLRAVSVGGACAIATLIVTGGNLGIASVGLACGAIFGFLRGDRGERSVKYF